MHFLVDAQLSPAIAAWINREFPEHEASSVRAHGLVHADDDQVFDKTRELDAVLITKDIDFVTLLQTRGAPPQVVWLTCGNTSNAALRLILREHLPTIVDLLETGENLIEVTGD